MLEKAVAALKENKEKALEMFNKGEGASRTGALRFCATRGGSIKAHPLKGETADIVGLTGLSARKRDHAEGH